jgi:pimeloyl-ACP methyl ester carboxylesterase
MSAITIDGQIVHFEALGRGQPVLFLHGWLGSWRYWMAAMAAISDKNRAYALDLWGFGDSGKAKTRYTLNDYVNLIEAFTEAIGLREMVLVGHTLGAIVALQYAGRNPDQVHKVLAVSLPLRWQDINRRLLNRSTTAGNDKFWLEKMWPWWQPVLPEEVQTEGEKTDSEAILSTLHEFAQFDLCQHLHHLGQSREQLLLTIFGEQDHLVSAKPLWSLNERWPNIRTMALAEAGHFPMLDQPAKFQRLLKDFLDLEDDLAVIALKKEWRRRAR